MEAIQTKKSRLRILHIYNTAGVASILAKFMDANFGTKSDVVTPKIADPYGLTVYGEVWNCGLAEFKVKVLLKAISYDVVHCHDTPGIAVWVKRLYPSKRVVLHYHGSLIRGKWVEKQKYWGKADVIVVGTPDLLEGSPDGTVYLPNAIDTSLFHPDGKHNPKTAFHISYNADDIAEEFAKKFGLDLTINNRKTNPIPYREMPNVLSNYEYYIDAKRDDNGRLLKANSKTGLEALACGCKVICWNGIVREGLPKEHEPLELARKLFEIYQSACSQ
jgi:glycosyltransferase involved in cell wall biosynthesis